MYMFHENIRLPGVYIFNANSTNNKGMQACPIYSTMSAMSILAINDSNNKVLVFPKYKIIFYANSAFGGTATTHDNTSGTKCIFQSTSNTASSCRVYYNNVEIDDCFSTTGT